MPLFGKRIINFKPENSREINRIMKGKINEKIVIVKNKCPGCSSEVNLTDTECGNCGLVFK